MSETTAEIATALSEGARGADNPDRLLVRRPAAEALRALMAAMAAADLLMLVVIGFMLIVSAWLPFLDSALMARWFTGTNFLYLSPVPILTALNATLLWRAVLKDREVQPFVLSLCFFALGFIGLVLGMWPNIVPPDMSIWDAASPPSSLARASPRSSTTSARTTFAPSLASRRAVAPPKPPAPPVISTDPFEMSMCSP